MRRENIIRPLLGVSRAQIEQYLAENGIEHIEDSTNFSDDYSRNLIRHRVMPVLRQINPALSDTAGRTAELLGRMRTAFLPSRPTSLRRTSMMGAFPRKSFLRCTGDSLARSAAAFRHGAFDGADRLSPQAVPGYRLAEP